MDWQIAAHVAAVIVPVATAVVIVIDMRLKLMIRENNDELIKRLDGTYMRKELCDARMEPLESPPDRRSPFAPYTPHRSR